MPTERLRSGERYWRLLLVFGAVVIAYIDRVNLALAAPRLSADLKLSSVQMGFIFSAFGWSYVACQIPAGRLVDRLAPRFLYSLMLGGWSVMTVGLGLAKGMTGLFGLRLGIGAFESPLFPANNRVVTTWFPQRERGGAIGFYTSGQFVGPAFLTWALAYIMAKLGWRWVFFTTGICGVLLSAVWWLFYREGQPHGETVMTTSVPFRWRNVATILKSRDMWGVLIGHLCGASTLWFFLTWFPDYLVTYRHIAVGNLGVGMALPYFAALIGVLVSGVFSDWLLRRGTKLATARKAPMIIGLGLSMFVLGANYVDRPSYVVGFMALACFGNGFASVGWTFVSALAPEGLIGLTGGVYNFVGNFSAIIVPIVIGFLVKGGRFEHALMFVCACAAVGMLAFIGLVKDANRIALVSQ